jgi:hypothetical protein
MNAPSHSTQLVNPFDRWFAPVEKLQGKSLMDHLYNRLDGAYPHKWRSNFPSQQAIDNWSTSWAEAFEEEGVTPVMIAGGLKACRTRYDWPPSCAEFIKACKPSVDPLVAYYEAVNGTQAREQGKKGDWSHPAIFWASVKVSAYDLKHASYSQIKQRWEKALSDEMEKGEWAPVPEALQALPAPGKSELSKEHAARMVTELKATETIKKAEDRTDHKLWAKRILAREKKGDKTLSALQVRFAREALNVAMP